MSWTKLGDEFADEAEALSDAAYRTHTEALQWSNRMLLDLVIPERHLRRFAGTPYPAAAVAELIASGWWEQRYAAWYIGCRYPEWQMERDEVLRDRARAQARMKRIRRHRKQDHSLCDPGSCKDAVRPNVTANELANARPNEGANVPPVFQGRDGTGRVGSETLPSRPGEAHRAVPGTEGSAWLAPGEELTRPGPDTYANGAAALRAALRKETT